jgi:hypothetical protein
MVMDKQEARDVLKHILTTQDLDNLDEVNRSLAIEAMETLGLKPKEPQIPVTSPEPSGTADAEVDELFGPELPVAQPTPAITPEKKPEAFLTDLVDSQGQPVLLKPGEKTLDPRTGDVVVMGEDGNLKSLSSYGGYQGPYQCQDLVPEIVGEESVDAERERLEKGLDEVMADIEKEHLGPTADEIDEAYGRVQEKLDGGGE